MSKTLIARYSFIDKVDECERPCGDKFDADDARADELVELGVCALAPEQPKPKRTARKRTTKPTE